MLTMEAMLEKFINEDKREQEKMEIFINEFRTTNELLLKEQKNLLSELKIEVYKLGRVMSDVVVSRHEIKGVTIRGGKMTSKATYGKEVNLDHNQPLGSKSNEHDKPKEVVVENEHPNILEQTTQTKLQQLTIPFPNRLRKEKEEAQQWKFLENLK
ncbi:hypothetical protein Tco_0845406 [Tanacetum coccineum]